MIFRCTPCRVFKFIVKMWSVVVGDDSAICSCSVQFCFEYTALGNLQFVCDTKSTELSRRGFVRDISTRVLKKIQVYTIRMRAGSVVEVTGSRWAVVERCYLPSLVRKKS